MKGVLEKMSPVEKNVGERSVGERNAGERCVGERSPGEKECRMKEVSENWSSGERSVRENESR